MKAVNKTVKKDIKFRVTEQVFTKYKSIVDYNTNRYNEQFNASRYFRLCLEKMNDHNFLIDIGYFNDRVQHFKALGLDPYDS